MNISVLLSLFLSTPTGTIPDLCADAMLGPDGSEIRDATGLHLSRYCEWSGPQAPVWDDHACCDVDAAGATCSAINSRDGSCAEGTRYYCEYGEQTPSGEVVCYQPLPSMCDAGLCVEAPPEVLPTLALIDPLVSCCDANGDCYYVGFDSGDCQGEILICLWGMTMEDGTVECFE